MCVGYACVTYPGRYSAARISPSTAPPARGPRRRAALPPRIKVKIDILKNKGATFAGALLVCGPILGEQDLANKVGQKCQIPEEIEFW